MYSGGTISMAFGVLLCFVLPVNDAYACQLALIDNPGSKGLYWRLTTISAGETLDWSTVTWNKVTST